MAGKIELDADELSTLLLDLYVGLGSIEHIISGEGPIEMAGRQTLALRLFVSKYFAKHCEEKKREWCAEDCDHVHLAVREKSASRLAALNLHLLAEQVQLDPENPRYVVSFKRGTLADGHDCIHTDEDESRSRSSTTTLH